MKKLVVGCLSVLFMSGGYAQTLFTYGSNSVSKNEFVKAFNKNPVNGANRKQALKEYLDLYINFKLKVKAAYDAKMQDDPTQLAELANFKLQIAENIINEEARLSELVQQAFDRSQKDIHLAQVFIEIPANGDTVQAFKNIQAAYNELKKGKDFKQVAAENSSDPAFRDNGGDIGFITVFTLPFEFENVAYNTTPGNFSAPFRSAIGYHIFKNTEERKPLGTRKVSQILIAYPPNGTAAEKAGAARKADSVYSLLKSGANFGDIARQVSNDMASAGNGGSLSEFGIGVYNPVFEKEAFALTENGQLSKPFETAFGYHILQLEQAIPVPADKTNIETIGTLQQKVQRDGRLEQAKKAMVEKQLKRIGFKPAVYNKEALWRYTDSAVINRNAPLSPINSKTLLFSFAKQNITVRDWVDHAKFARSMSNENATRSYAELMKSFVEQSAAQYYRTHLEDYSPEYRQQVSEFKDANLLFGIMDSRVWSKANADTMGLKAYYNKHKEKYNWGPSAEALVVTCNNESIAGELQQKIKDRPSEWRTIIEGYNNQVNADSGRYELGQLPVVDRTRFEEGLITAPVKNQGDNSVTFNYIFALHNNPAERSFDDAKGLVISDYQQVLENQWIETLKKKYPVKVNMAVFNSIK